MTAGLLLLAALILAAIVAGMLVPRYRPAATLAVVALIVAAMVFTTKPHIHPRGVTHAFVSTAPTRGP